jgi:hypothetical protein
LVHSDAVQSFGKSDLDVVKLGVDLLTVSAHKIYGPKGVGALYVRKGIDICPLIYGGRQERGSRAGTENTIGIVGFGEAARILLERGRKDREGIEALTDALRKGIEETIPKVRFNGHPKKRVKNTLNIAFPGLESEAILLALATKGFRFRRAPPAARSPKRSAMSSWPSGSGRDRALLHPGVAGALQHRGGCRLVLHELPALSPSCDRSRPSTPENEGAGGKAQAGCDQAGPPIARLSCRRRTRLVSRKNPW